MQGIGPANEAVFFHKKTKTLIVTDLCVFIKAKVRSSSRARFRGIAVPYGPHCATCGCGRSLWRWWMYLTSWQPLVTTTPNPFQQTQSPHASTSRLV